ncbi:MAG TPA: class I SAM-dependent methyltransferase [Candidatus Binatia bacterium]|nr:class I SAM-dependent methyltransferase [Candidatus Binatia bacterium]
MSDPFFTLYRDLPRYGPGCDDATREALRRLGPLAPRSRVLDLGCGNGAQTLVLAASLDDPSVTAVDLHQPFLDELTVAAAHTGLGDRIHTRCDDFGALDEPPGCADLLWSEGAIYHLGFAGGLQRWRPLLAPDGRAAVTELTWLTDAPPDDAATFWRDAYPAMTTEDGNRAAADEVGWIVDDTFTLPASAWWESYYAPLAARIAVLRPDADDALRAVIADTEREIDLWIDHGGAYGYVFYLLRPC